MSTQPPVKKSASNIATKPNPSPKTTPPGPPRKRVSSTPLTSTPPKGRDWWPWNFMAGMLVVIFGIGGLVWGLRAVISAAPATPVPVPTITAVAALPTQEPPQGTPVAGPIATATLAAPDALTNGPYATIMPITSTVGTLAEAQIRPTIIPFIPSGRLAVSAETQDWGQITVSKIISAVLTVANTGNGPVHIDQMLSSCKCLVGHMSAQDLPVGNRATLVVLYDPSNDTQSGVLTNTLSILSTAGDETVKTLTFKADLR